MTAATFADGALNSPPNLDIDVSSTQLRAFVTLAETLSYSEAADILGYTEPAIHYQIKRLNNLLGHQLFTRSGRGLALTAEGAAALPHSIAALRSIDSFAEAAHQRSHIRRVTVAGGLVTASYILPDVISGFMNIHQDCTIELQIGTAEEVARRVLRGEAELGISGRLDRLAQETGIRIIPWKYETYSLFCSPSFDPSHQSWNTIYSLAGMTEPLSMLLGQLELLHEVAPLLKFLQSIDAAKNICIANLGRVFLPTRAVTLEQKMGILHETSFGSKPITGILWICYNDESALTPEALQLLRYLLNDRDSLLGN